MSQFSRRAWLLALAAILAVPLGALALALALDAGLLREGLIRTVAACAQRGIRVRGPMQVRLLTLHPSVRAQAVEIDNPPWTPPGRLGRVRALSLVIDIPWFHRPFTIESLEIEGAELTLERDARSLANWQWTDPRKPGRRGLPFVRRLQLEQSHLTLDDELRHLRFDGEIMTENAPGEARAADAQSASSPLRLRAQGVMNGARTFIELDGDPLATASSGRPYRYTFRERSEQGQLQGMGVLSEPFFLDRTQGSFESTGQNLAALYQLAGVRLLPTGPYRSGGEFVRAGSSSQFHRLHITSGGSDMQAEVAIDSSSPRARMVVTLESERLRLQDLGAEAARGAGANGPPRPSRPAQLPARPLELAAVRRSDALYVLRARHLEISRYALSDVSGRLQIERGVMTLEPLAANGFDGRLSARGSLDATRADPAVQLELRADDLSLADFDSHGPSGAPIDARLTGRVALRGAGRSLQQMAASANGSVQFHLSPGLMRASLAELIGLDLRGLGLTLAKSRRETPIRCGEIDFRAHAGVLTSRSLLLDTERVLIEGAGTVDLGTESIDLALHGYPKGVRFFKLDSSIKIAGTLLHPSASLDTRHGKLSLLDVGRAKDIDCGQAGEREEARSPE